MAEVKFVLGDKVVLDNKEGEVKAVSQVALDNGAGVVKKYTVSFPNGSVKQYVEAKDLVAVEKPEDVVEEEVKAEAKPEVKVDQKAEVKVAPVVANKPEVKE